MKKTILCLALCLPLWITSCTKDDNAVAPIIEVPTPPTAAELLVGDWLLHENGVILNGIKVKEPLDECEEKDFFTFDKEGNFKDIYHQNVDDKSCVPFTDKGIYQLVGDQLTMHYVDSEVDIDLEDPIVATVVTLNTEILEVSISQDFGGQNIQGYQIMKRIIK